MAATLKDIAKRTGLSVPSVCLILNGRGEKFREETRQLVLDAAKALKYRPDMVMRRMGRASTRRDAIGFLVRSESPSPIADQVIHEYLCGVNDVLLEHDQLMVMAKLSHLVEQPGKAPPRLIAERFIDGLLLVETALPESLERLIEHYEIVTVWVSSQRHGETDCAYPDDIHAGRVATEHLLSLGHRRIGFVPTRWAAPDGSVSERHSSIRRAQGYRDVMTSANREPLLFDCRACSEPTNPTGADEAETFTTVEHEQVCQLVVDSHKTADPITGVVVSSYGNAIRLREQLMRHDLTCPGDVSIVAAGDLHLFRHGWSQVTRVQCDRYTIGRWGAEMLLDKLNHNSEPQPSRIYRGQLVPGETCAAPKV